MIFPSFEESKSERIDVDHREEELLPVDRSDSSVILRPKEGSERVVHSRGYGDCHDRDEGEGEDIDPRASGRDDQDDRDELSWQIESDIHDALEGDDDAHETEEREWIEGACEIKKCRYIWKDPERHEPPYDEVDSERDERKEWHERIISKKREYTNHEKSHKVGDGGFCVLFSHRFPCEHEHITPLCFIEALRSILDRFEASEERDEWISWCIGRYLSCSMRASMLWGVCMSEECADGAREFLLEMRITHDRKWREWFDF